MLDPLQGVKRPRDACLARPERRDNLLSFMISGNVLKRNIDQMVQSEQLLQRDVIKYDEAPEWQLP